MSGFDYGGKLPDGQHERHPMLPPEERKPMVRPVRTAYRHLGQRPTGLTRPLTEHEQRVYEGNGYVSFEPYPPEAAPLTGRFWTEQQLASGCGQITSMGLSLAETYAVRPTYYGRTFCATCHDYFEVGAKGEFVWVEQDGTDGPRVGT